MEEKIISKNMGQVPKTQHPRNGTTRSGRERNRSIASEGQRQALGHIGSYREWQALGKSYSYIKATPHGHAME